MDDWQDFILNALFGIGYFIWQIIKWVLWLPIKLIIDVARGAYGKAVEYLSWLVALAVLGLIARLFVK
jgi:hypothetical protein